MGSCSLTVTSRCILASSGDGGRDVYSGGGPAVRAQPFFPPLACRDPSGAGWVVIPQIAFFAIVTSSLVESSWTCRRSRLVRISEVGGCSVAFPR